MKRIILSAIFCWLSLVGSSLYAQQFLDWSTLADVSFQDRMSSSFGIQYQVATFGETIRSYEGKEVIVKGYLIPLDPLGVSYVLSMNPNSRCFFCGGGGPETIVELRVKPEHMQRYETDEIRAFQGVLRLYESNLEQFNYVLELAEPL
jgi:hypothetical protein